MQVPNHELKPGETEAVVVQGIRVSRMGRSGWSLSVSAMQALWTQVQAENPAQSSEKVYTGMLAGYSAAFTKTQGQAYTAQMQRLIRAARRAGQPDRAEKRAEKRAHAAHYLTVTAAALSR